MYARINRENGTVSLYDNQHNLLGTHSAKEGNIVAIIDELKKNRSLRSVTNFFRPSSEQIPRMPYEDFLERMFPEEFGEKAIQENKEEVLTGLVEKLADIIAEDDCECDCERCRRDREEPVDQGELCYTEQHLIFMSATPPPPHLYSLFTIHYIELVTVGSIQERFDGAMDALRYVTRHLARKTYPSLVKLCVMADSLLTFRILNRGGSMEPFYLQSDGELVPFRGGEHPWIN